MNPFKVHSLFGDFADKDKYNGAVPTGPFLAHAHKMHHGLISDHLDKEVKKRGADTLHWDASFKEAKHLCQYRGKQIFKGLITGMNGLGEVRIQFHVYTDSHDQMVTAIEAFKRTNANLGLSGPRIFVTDNPTGDFPTYKHNISHLGQITIYSRSR